MRPEIMNIAEVGRIFAFKIHCPHLVDILDMLAAAALHPDPDRSRYPSRRDHLQPLETFRIKFFPDVILMLKADCYQGYVSTGHSHTRTRGHSALGANGNTRTLIN